MSDNWVKAYIEKLNSRRKENAAKMRKATWAEQGAGVAFERLRRRLKRDIELLQAEDRDYRLAYEELPSGKVRIHREVYPSATLEVELRGVTVSYHYRFRQDETCESKESDPQSLRIASDDEGAVQIYKNGAPYADESNVSEDLLKTVFDFITQ